MNSGISPSIHIKKLSLNSSKSSSMGVYPGQSLFIPTPPFLSGHLAESIADKKITSEEYNHTHGLFKMDEELEREGSEKENRRYENSSQVEKFSTKNVKMPESFFKLNSPVLEPVSSSTSKPIAINGEPLIIEKTLVSKSFNASPSLLTLALKSLSPKT